MLSQQRHNLFLHTYQVVDKFFHKGINFVISSEQQRLEHKEYDTRARPLPSHNTIETKYVRKASNSVICYEI
jgi:hypothetical protein